MREGEGALLHFRSLACKISDKADDFGGDDEFEDWSSFFGF